MDFGDVIKEMKKNPSKRFARKGWNGRNMFIYLTLGREVPLRDWEGASSMTNKELQRETITICPHIDMYSATGERVIGWLASQTDMLADDWYEVRQ